MPSLMQRPGRSWLHQGFPLLLHVVQKKAQYLWRLLTADAMQQTKVVRAAAWQFWAGMAAAQVRAASWMHC